MNNTTVVTIDPFQAFVADYLRTLPYWFLFRALLFGISLPLYLCIIIVFIKSKFYLKSPFFVISISLGIADIINMCGRISTFVIPAAGTLFYGQVQEIYRGSAVRKKTFVENKTQNIIF
jgi:hypothetical protein